ncbi:MFS transporter [Siccirubricoccus sp. KC 17139]|uniref:MFS transporter n=1 Tax=Siccirubricoccus soli TaxID=2899147 RepID=A0ABT1D7Q7_9PROT|nr:MFS transporter [Siccirubricoccus soli]MCO6417972.1 MFS transporter [Siccirubricoccus soli]MCP2684107.1 MFS transporter [Siccirubricoccus soli]
MSIAGLEAGRATGFAGFTRYQWRIFWVTWLGWALDSADFGLFAIVLRPALTELLGGAPSTAEIGRVGGTLAMVGLLGWAIGGMLFGMVADYLGRVRTLAISIILFSLCTALQGVAQTPFQLGLFRFLAGLGTGAEAVVGIALVAEAFHGAHRAKVLGIMMTGGAFGPLIGGQVYNLLGPYGWRYVFFAGILPAILLLLLRRSTQEPTHFAAVQARRASIRARGEAASAEDQAFMQAPLRQLLSPGLRFSTFIGMLFCLGTLLSIWTTQIWLPTIQGLMLEKDGITGTAAIHHIGNGMMLFGLGGIAGYAAFGFLADWFGRRPTVIFYNLGAIASGLTLYLGLEGWQYYPVLLPVFGFLVIGVFSGHAVYLPELFPTHARATAISFCNGTARIITSFGPLVAGLLVVPFGGSFNKAAAVMTCLAVLSILAMLLGRETRDEALPR